MLSYALYFFLLCHVFSRIPTTTAATPAYTATDFILLNCGESSNLNDTSRRTWHGDDRSRYGPSYSTSISSSFTASSMHPSVFQVPYGTTRIFRSHFTYTFPLRKGPKFLRLYFYPDIYSDFITSQSFFSVTANGFTLLSNFSAFVYSLSSRQPSFMKEFIISIEENQSLVLTFSPNPDSFAFVNGIEIVSIPDKLYFRGHNVLIKFVDQLFYLMNSSSTVLENLYRLNVGGNRVEIQDDSHGMFRAWSPDDEYIFAADSGCTPHDQHLQINYTAETPPYSAPEIVYTTSRMMADHSIDLEWEFSVDSGFYYLLKLYFCEIQLEVTEQNDRVFTIFINNRTAEIQADIISWTGGTRIPIVRDYITWVPYDSRRAKQHLRLSLIPNLEPNPKYHGALLNGLEIFKLIDFNQGLAAPNLQPWMVSLPPALALKLPRKKKSRGHVLIDSSSILASSPIQPNTFMLDSPATNPMKISAPPEQHIFNQSFQDYPSNITSSPLNSPPKSHPDIIRTSASISTPIIGIVTSAIALVIGVSFLIFLGRQRMRDSATASAPRIDMVPLRNEARAAMRSMVAGVSVPPDLCARFPLDDMKNATDNFLDDLVLGEGGFGKVYKGFMNAGETIVAIKKLNPLSVQGRHEFLTEIKMLSDLSHGNLISLIGYCDENGEMMLVSDYMAHGTLRDHLYGSNHSPLSWMRRLQICIGAAKGLHYLHTGAIRAIIHRDVKSSNILLDENWVAKVSDFGLSKLAPIISGIETGHVNTMVKGSFGYIDPEYTQLQQLTDKSDVYSFGVVLFEVLCCRPPVSHDRPREQVNLAKWAKFCFSKGILERIIDSNLNGKIAPECLNKFAETADWCLRDNGIDRPAMSNVLRNLECAMQLQEAAESRGGGVAIGGGDSFHELSPSFPLPLNAEASETDEDFHTAPSSMV